MTAAPSPDTFAASSTSASAWTPHSLASVAKACHQSRKRTGCRKNLLANLKRLNPEVLKCNYKVVSAIKPKPSFSQLIFLCSHSSKPKPSFLQLIFCVLIHPSRNLHSSSSSFCVLIHPSRNLHSYSSSVVFSFIQAETFIPTAHLSVFSFIQAETFIPTAHLVFSHYRNTHAYRFTPRVFTYSPLYIHIF